MKITDVRCFQVTGHDDKPSPRRETRKCQPLDVYEELKQREPDPIGPAAPPAPAPKDRPVVQAIYVEIATDGGLTGMYGPLLKEQAFIILSKYRSFLIGRDPLAGEALWDQMRGLDRHARTGYMMMALSALDCALWDLRGKHYNAPVYRLLGGPTRRRIKAYASMGGHPTQPGAAAECAAGVARQGYQAQKWFFPCGPADGAEGRRRDLALVEALREAVGDEVDLMFDAAWGWDVPFAIDMARAMAPYRPLWLEEPLLPERLEGYCRIKQATGATLAAGEHLYTRWDVRPFLEARALDYIQADPDWTGGITEMVKICALAAAFDVKVVPHGHGALAAAHVVASQAPQLCPMVEYLFRHLDRMQFFHKTVLRPEGGWITLPTAPGLGLELDESKIEKTEDLKAF